MSLPENILEVKSSPHLKGALSTPMIMRHVLYSLLPVSLAAVYYFGISALALLVTTTTVAPATELMLQKVTHRPTTLRDGSAVLTGLLFGLTLPPALPLWMAALGSVLSIVLGKFVFGGLGKNLFNPALVGRAFLMAAFPVPLTSWVYPLSPNRFFAFHSSTLAWPLQNPAMSDAVSGATPLGLFKFGGELTNPELLYSGAIAGSVGETAAFLILLGGAYLALRRMLDWRIPVAVLGAVAILSALLSTVEPTLCPGPLFMLGSGGLMLGAVYMATDPVSSPLTPVGVWLFGFLIGGLVVLIRLAGGLPEGVMYAILLGNAATPLLDRIHQRRVYGQ
ncbi:MAG: RnfABCDGE type electron transport complex subunit D [Spirochaetales bacterium]|nr:RnfABCDGE type electron transport complex subunit D [Leptospiraceae bacterium]MCP5481523.1 RnfABCDGE type electron transport complex subunit D [Spirochaetales bacterium]